jgi:phosphoribosylanthranilate isomerase
VLFDARPPPGAVLPGGNGLAFDWRILDGIAGRFPFALSGGLDPGNVAGAIRLTHPDIVDVSSGVERLPGEKDARLIQQFIAAARAAG